MQTHHCEKTAEKCSTLGLTAATHSGEGGMKGELVAI